MTGNYSRFQLEWRGRDATETTLVRIVKDIRRAASEGKCIVLISLAISAAFDAADRTRLLSLPDDVFGTCRADLDWLRSVLVRCGRRLAIRAFIPARRRSLF